MNEASIPGRFRPLVQQCRSRSCPCPAGTCQLGSAIRDVEQECGSLSPTLQSLRNEIEERLAEIEAACVADTDPDFFANLQDHPRTRERRSETRFQLEETPAHVILATGESTEALLIDASYQGAGILVPKSVASFAMIGDHVQVTAPELCQIAEIRGAADSDNQTRLSVIWIEDLLH